MSNGYRLSHSYKLQSYVSEFEQFSLFVDIMQPQRGYDRPQRVPVDEEATLAPHAPHAPSPQDDPQFPSKLLFCPSRKLGFSHR